MVGLPPPYHGIASGYVALMSLFVVPFDAFLTMKDRREPCDGQPHECQRKLKLKLKLKLFFEFKLLLKLWALCQPFECQLPECSCWASILLWVASRCSSARALGASCSRRITRSRCHHGSRGFGLLVGALVLAVYWSVLQTSCPSSR